MAKNKKGQKVVFRRINGRVVPIKMKGNRVTPEGRRRGLKAMSSKTKSKNYDKAWESSIEKRSKGDRLKHAGAMTALVGGGLSAGLSQFAKTGKGKAIATIAGLATGGALGAKSYSAKTVRNEEKFHRNLRKMTDDRIRNAPIVKKR